MIPAVPLRDDCQEAGRAVYIGSVSGERLSSAGALVVNAATETIDFHAVTESTVELALARLLGDGESRWLPDDVVFLTSAADPATAALVTTGHHAAAIRENPAGGAKAAAQLRWLNRPPRPDSRPARLVRRLAERGLLLEPAQRLARLLSSDPTRISGAQLAPPLDAYLRPRGAIEWPHDFLPYQLDGIRALIQRPTLLLADDMGLGKTVQATAALRILIRTAAIQNALIVTPASILAQWYRALKDWAPDLRISTVEGADRAWRWRVDVHAYLVSFETLRADYTANPQAGPRRRTWGAVILDEAQRIKNRDVDASRYCKRLSRERSWALTGTPLENQVDDLRSICEFLVSTEREAADLADLEQLRAFYAGVRLRRRKQDVLTQLPPKTVIPVRVRLGTRQRASYDRAEGEGVVWLRQLGTSVTITHVLELITRLKQICNFCPESGESVKLDDLDRRLEELVAEGHRALLFTQYTDAQFGAAALARRLSAHAPEVYTGSMTQEEREAVLRRFRTALEPRPLILSLRAGGLGLNLQEASYVFHFDRWWNPAIEHQAEDRSHRLGQTRPVTVYSYICEDTIEERIQAILAAKSELFRDWIDDSGLQRSASLTESEIFGLVGLDAPRAAGLPASRIAPTESTA